jgi:hypothetical protein
MVKGDACTVRYELTHDFVKITHSAFSSPLLTSLQRPDVIVLQLARS